MNNQKLQKKNVSIFQEKTSSKKQKSSSIFKKLPCMEIKPTNNWRILKIGLSSKRIKKRKNMTEVATSLYNSKYFNNLKRIAFDTEYHTLAIPANPMEDKGNLNEPIIIKDEIDEEESSDCEYERKKRLYSQLQLSARVQLTRVLHREPRESHFEVQQMQKNKAEKEIPVEHNLPKGPEIVSSPVSLAGIPSSKPDTNLNYKKPQTHQTRIENYLKEHVDQNVTTQSIPKPSCSDDKCNALRTLLESPNTPPKKRYTQLKPVPIVRKTTGGVPMDLSGLSQNERPTSSFISDTQSHPSTSHENQMEANLENNPQMQPMNSGGFSGGHCSFQQTNLQYLEKQTKPTAQGTLNLTSQPSQSAQRTQERPAVTNRDPRIMAHNPNQNTPIDKQTYLDSSQHFQQFNEAPPQNQNPTIHENIYLPEPHPQLVAQSFTKLLYTFQQFNPQNNANRRLPSALHCPSSYLPQQENLPSGYPPDLMYWAQLGMGMWARENMTKNILPAINHQIQYSPYQLPSQDQDMQAVHETPAVNMADVSNQYVYSENTAQNPTVIQNTSDFKTQPSTSVQNAMEQTHLPVNIKESDNAPRTIDISTRTPNVMKHIEQNTKFVMDTPTTIENSPDAVKESANSENAIEFIRQLNDCFEQLKLTTNKINDQLKNKSMFDNSELMDEVMKRVHNYCTCDTNVYASTSQDAVAANRIVKKRDHRNTSADSKNNYYDDDEKDEDYRIDTDEDDDSDKEPKRKLVRISFDLPPEYDPDDTRWTLRHRGPGFGLVELIPNSNVFVNEWQVMNCKRVAQNSNALARMLLVEVFSYNALTVCTLTGGKPITSYYKVEGNFRPGLDKNAREVLVAYVQQFAQANKWRKVSTNSILNTMRFKLKSMREKARKYKDQL